MNHPSPLVRTTTDRQRGAALLVFMLIFFMASMSLILLQTGALHARTRADQTTSAALAQAKEALIGRAAADNNRPGSLPCPAGSDDGIAELLSGNACPSYVGRLPWRTLNSPRLLDGNGSTLWYVLAQALRDDDSAAPINPTTALGLSLDGATNIAAVVFSGGPPIAGQNGRPSNDVDDYLDGANKDGGPYVSGPISSTFNDKTIAVSHDQLFGIVNRRILGLLNAGLEQYYAANANHYPEDSANLKTELAPYLETNVKDMLDENGWYAITNYTPAPNRKSATLTITDSPVTTCAITPEQKPSCTNP